MKLLPVQPRASLSSTRWAASATISAVRDALITASPPSRFWTAAVAIVDLGQSVLAAIPRARNSAAKASVSRVIPYFLNVYAGSRPTHFEASAIGGER